MNSELPLQLVQLLNYLMMLLTVVLIIWLAIKYGGNMMDGLKGDNKRWDIPEIMVVFFLPLSVVALIMDLFLNVTLSIEAWAFLAAGLGIGSGTRAYQEKAKPPTKSESLGTEG